MEFQIIYVRYSEFLQNLHRVFRQMTSEIAITRVMSLFFNFFVQFCDDMEFYFSLFLAEFFFSMFIKVLWIQLSSPNTHSIFLSTIKYLRCEFLSYCIRLRCLFLFTSYISKILLILELYWSQNIDSQRIFSYLYRTRSSKERTPVVQSYSIQTSVILPWWHYFSSAFCRNIRVSLLYHQR